MRHARTRWLITAVALLATLATALLAGPALRSALADSNRPQEYLALGDSVAFGFNPLVDPHNADNFIGYPTPVAAALKENLTNASCPGETSTHFIDLTSSDPSCRTSRANHPPHLTDSRTPIASAYTF